MVKARTTAEEMKNVNLTPAEQVWSRQLYLHAQPEHERGGAEETAGRARG